MIPNGFRKPRRFSIGTVPMISHRREKQRAITQIQTNPGTGEPLSPNGPDEETKYGTARPETSSRIFARQRNRGSGDRSSLCAPQRRPHEEEYPKICSDDRRSSG